MTKDRLDRFRFRAWDTEKKELIYDAELAYDYMRPCSGGKIIEADCFGDVLANKRYIVEQSTGLKDKNGRLIYENDVVSCGHPDIGYVKWKDGGFWVSGWNYVIPWNFFTTHKWEVLGNVHENPELLEDNNASKN